MDDRDRWIGGGGGHEAPGIAVYNLVSVERRGRGGGPSHQDKDFMAVTGGMLCLYNGFLPFNCYVVFLPI